MPEDNYNMKYIPKFNTREYNTFTEEYFAGADVTISLNGKVMSNVSSLSYTVQEQQKPIYGYASRIFDDVSIGNRVVVGSIRVPIVNNGIVVRPNVDKKQTVVDDPELPSWLVDKQKANADSKKRNTQSMVDYESTYDNTLITEDGNELTEEGIETSSVISKDVFNEDTKNVQIRLRILGYGCEVSGFYDSGTIGAVRQFQTDNGLIGTGILDLYTMGVILGSQYVDRYIVIAAEGTDLKTGPYDNASFLEQLPVNTIVTLTKKYNDWFVSIVANDWMIVKTENNVVGYVVKSALEVVL